MSNSLESDKEEQAMATRPQVLVLPPEEGLQGWLCVLWGFICLFCTFGFLNAYMPSTISWIFAVQLALMWEPGPLFGRLVDTYGAGLGLVAYLRQLSSVGQWFVDGRGLAIGIASTGGSLGGVIFPVFLDRVRKAIGLNGAVRYTALLMGILLAISCFLIWARLPRKKWNPNLKWFDLTLFTDKQFAFYSLGAYFVI
ncbi:hypothetical protein F5B20DRAFT_593347 [Whalleya microplaca]|nr:hypothetical protein F5B20DRAFT_593347 [Whalleya microplaca]